MATVAAIGDAGTVLARSLGSRGNDHRLLPLLAAVGGIAVLLRGAAVPIWPSRHLGHGAGDAVMVGAGMALAMMGPLALPLANAVARSSLWWRRRRNVAIALGAFLAVWVVVSTGIHIVAMVPLGPWTVAGLAVVGAACCAGRQFAPRHEVRIARCHRTQPIRPRRQGRDAAGWGLRASRDCIRICALPMIIMSLVGGWSLLIVVTVALIFERHYSPRPWRPIACSYALVGVAAVLVALAVPSADHDQHHHATSTHTDQ